MPYELDSNEIFIVDCSSLISQQHWSMTEYTAIPSWWIVKNLMYFTQKWENME